MMVKRAEAGQDRGGVRVGYELKSFPCLSQTFILNEILELERQGVPIEIFSLEEPIEEVRHEALKKVQAQVTYLPKNSSLQGKIREGRYADGTFQQRPFKKLFQVERVPDPEPKMSVDLRGLECVTNHILAMAHEQEESSGVRP